MSWNPDILILPFEVLTDKRLTLRQIRVLMAIASWRKSNTNLARVSRKMLSERADLPVSRISEVTTQLVEMGWIVKHGDGGRGKWSYYSFADLDSFKRESKKSTQKPKQNRTSKQAKNSYQTSNGYQNRNGYQNGNETVTDSVSKTVTDSVTHKHTERSTEKDTERDTPRTSARGDRLAETGFYDFLKSYPQHRRARGKQLKEAEDLWLKKNPNGELTDQIKAGLEAHRKSKDWQKEGGKYVLGMLNFIDRESWDALPEPTGTAVSTSTQPGGPRVTASDLAEIKRHAGIGQ